MRSSLTVLAVVPVLTLAGCASSGSSAATAQAPDGVQEQYTVLQEEIDENGGQTTSGPWEVGYIVEAAEPWLEGTGGAQRMREPEAGETHHLEVIPRERSTGRIVPDVPVRLDVLDAQGKVVDSRKLNFLYSTFFHYANNFRVPEDGRYTLRVSLQPPTFYRHAEPGEEPALNQPATVEFEDVELASE